MHDIAAADMPPLPKIGDRYPGLDDQFDRTVDAATVMEAKPFELFLKLRNDLLNCPKVLEVGAMFGDMLMAAPGPVRVAIEVHRPYVSRGKDRYGKHMVYVCREALEGVHLFTEDEFDAVIMIDFIEHLEKVQGQILITAAKQVCRKIVLFTPKGFVERSVDIFGLGGEHWQTHRSGWTQKELYDLGFQVTLWEQFHKEEYPQQPDALYAVWEK